MSADEQRRRFEEWQKQPVEWLVRPKHPDGGSYADPRIETEWIVWQAAQPTYEQLEEIARKIAARLTISFGDELAHTRLKDKNATWVLQILMIMYLT